jgi:hypothetical protein
MMLSDEPKPPKTEGVDGTRNEQQRALEDLLVDYDIQKIRTLTAGFRYGAPVGKEMM